MPDRLEGYGYYEADQDGGTGQWISSQQHFEEELLAAIMILLEASESTESSTIAT
jgi:hypothetical protein